MNKLILGIVVAGLIVTPIAIQSALAFKETNFEIRVNVDFERTEQTDIDSLVNDLDQGLFEDSIFETLDPIALGQFGPEDIVADWSLGVNPNGQSNLEVNPVITEINTAQGVNKATIQDQLVNGGDICRAPACQGWTRYNSWNIANLWHHRIQMDNVL